MLGEETTSDTEYTITRECERLLKQSCKGSNNWRNVASEATLEVCQQERRAMQLNRHSLNRGALEVEALEKAKIMMPLHIPVAPLPDSNIHTPADSNAAPTQASHP